MKIDASIILDAKYDQRLMKYVCCELLGIQLRSLTFTQDLLFLVAKTVRLVMADSSAAGFTGYVWTEAVSGKKIVAGSKISGYVWTGPKAVKFVRRGA